MIAASFRFSMLVSAAVRLVASTGCGEASEAWSEPEVLFEDAAFSASDADIAMDAEGNAIVIWSQGPTECCGTSRYSVWARRFVRGSGWQPATKLGDVSGRRGASNPDVAVNASGRAIAVWQEWAADRDDQTGAGIWAAHFVPEVGWDAPFLLGSRGFAASVALNDDGRAAAIWTGYEVSDDSPATVSASTYDPTTGWDAPTMLESFCFWLDDSDGDGEVRAGVGGGASDPHVAMNERGEAIAIWHGEGADTLAACGPELYGPKVSRFSPGSGWERPNTARGWGHLNASPLGMDATGRALIGRLTDVPAERPRPLDFVPDHNASVAVSESGHAMVAWRQGEWILGSYFGPDEGWSPPETIGRRLIAPPTDMEMAASKSLGIINSNGIDLAINERGQCTVVWHTIGAWNYNPPHSSWKFSVWGNRFEPGVGWSTPSALSTDATREAYVPRITIDELGRGIAVWQEAEEYVGKRVRVRSARLD